MGSGALSWPWQPFLWPSARQVFSCNDPGAPSVVQGSLPLLGCLAQGSVTQHQDWAAVPGDSPCPACELQDQGFGRFSFKLFFILPNLKNGGEDLAGLFPSLTPCLNKVPRTAESN